MTWRASNQVSYLLTMCEWTWGEGCCELPIIIVWLVLNKALSSLSLLLFILIQAIPIYLILIFYPLLAFKFLNPWEPTRTYDKITTNKRQSSVSWTHIGSVFIGKRKWSMLKFVLKMSIFKPSARNNSNVSEGNKNHKYDIFYSINTRLPINSHSFTNKFW